MNDINNALLNHIITKQVSQDIKLDFILRYFSEKDNINFEELDKRIEEKTKEALIDSWQQVSDIMDKVEEYRKNNSPLDGPLSDSDR
ncbi:hypothetical protein GH721_13950 [Kriegella sp. EG-1]|nr:hypothetical protein [Flavobacteriaceae bacterium EG-1]